MSNSPKVPGPSSSIPFKRAGSMSPESSTRQSKTRHTDSNDSVKPTVEDDQLDEIDEKIYALLNVAGFSPLSILLAIARSDPKVDQKYKEMDDAMLLLEKETWLGPRLLEIAENRRSFNEIRTDSIFRRATALRLIDKLPSLVSSAQSMSATTLSWGVKFVGNANDLLYQHLEHYSKIKNQYARYTSIVQSSGMGKSRAIDELSKTHLVVPLNLRDNSTGFPPPDKRVLLWFLQSTRKSNAFTRSCAFLCTLFVKLLEYLQGIDSKIAGLPFDNNNERPKSKEGKFRLLMTAGQTFSDQGQLRRQFYDAVLELADKLIRFLESPPSEPKPPPPPELKLDLHEGDGDVESYLKCKTGILMSYLNKGSNNNPALILSFDEAHTLTRIERDDVDGLWSVFSELRRALQVIYSFPCFSVFLSTTGKMQQFMPQPRNDISARIQREDLSLIPPFCELGFDQLAEKARGGETTLEHVSSLAFMARLGRPLFAARYIEGNENIKDGIVKFAGEKLLCKGFSSEYKFVSELSPLERMACMSVRIPLEFNANAKTIESEDMERSLVEKHMRVCLSVNRGFETAVTIAPSEPLLVEASCLLMQSPAFDLPRSLLFELQRPGLDKGSRGELIVMALCLEARDIAAAKLVNDNKRVIPVNDFIKELLVASAHEKVLCSKPSMARTPKNAGTTLQKTFDQSKMYFTHFVKVRSKNIINQKFLWRLIVRGAAVLCADYQKGVDIIIPFLFRGTTISRRNVSAFLIQSKNDSSFQDSPTLFLFDAMNPYQIEFFGKEETNPVPVIRMVFALASKTSCVTVPESPQKIRPKRKRTPKAQFQADMYTAFDIWCAKASSKTFGPVKDDKTFDSLLLRSGSFLDVYEAKMSEDIQNVSRNMNPATDDHQSHWERYCESEEAEVTSEAGTSK